jgi:hypothetical protein
MKMGSEEKWFGWYPPPYLYAYVRKFDPHYQVAWQVAHFRQYYAQFATHTIQLEDLCERPYRVLREMMGERVKHQLPARALKFRRYSDEEREPFREVYEAYDENLSHAPA